MNQEDILALVRAGFSRSEILAMQTPAAPQPEPAPAAPQPAPAEPQPDPEPAPQPEPEPAPAAPQPEPAPAAPQPAPAAQPAQPSNQDVLAAINSLTAAIQNINRNSAQQPGQNRITGDDVMAGFIRPPRSDNK